LCAIRELRKEARKRPPTARHPDTQRCNDATAGDGGGDDLHCDLAGVSLG